MNDDYVPPPSFAVWAAMFEGSLAIVAVALGWLSGRPPMAAFSGDLRWWAMSLAAVLPMLVVLGLCLWLPFRPFVDIMRIVDGVLAPLFRHCHVVELAAIALLAGVGEEMLFRGVLQPALAHWATGFVSRWAGPLDAAVAANWLAAVVVAVAFGMAHAVNLSYAVLAGVIGLYLGWLWMASGGDLTLPVGAHAIYDFLALVYVARIRRPRLPPDAQA